MTHDELLAKIKTNLASYVNKGYGRKKNLELWINIIASLEALRAVVEIADKDIEHESLVWLSGYCFAMEQVVQAIEKELQ